MSENSINSVNQVFNTNICNKKLLPVWCSNLGNTLYSIGPISDNRSPSINHVRFTGNQYETPLRSAATVKMVEIILVSLKQS